MERTENQDGTVEMKAAPGEDLRHFDVNGRFTCNPDHPWSGNREDAPNGVRHENASEVGEQEDGYPGGDIVTYECADCGHRWKSELPQ